MKTARTGQNPPFRTIIRQYAGSVHTQAMRLLGNDQDADEATQDVFLKIYRGLRRYRGDADLATWIYRITMNVCISRRRKSSPPEIPFENLDVAEAAASDDENPEVHYVRKESKRHLGRLISRLSPKEIQALTLFYYDELPYEKIAEIMKIPSGSVATILHRARARLHVHMLVEEKEGPR